MPGDSPRWVLSPAAGRDLTKILAYVQRESRSERVVLKLLDDFEESFGKICDAPQAGRLRPDLTDGPIRWRPVHRYLIAYDADSEPLRILRVIHGARHLPDAVGEER